MDCLICFESHETRECPERLPQHCPDCHIYIQNCSDHTPVCASKTWLFKKFAGVYSEVPKERCIIGFSSPFRFLKDGSWQKGSEGMELCSSSVGALFRFKSDQDLSLFMTRFQPVRIVIVVKGKSGEDECGTFVEKLVLQTSREKFMVVAQTNEPFDRNEIKKKTQHNTTLFLAVSANDNPKITVNMFPDNQTTRSYEYAFDSKQSNTFISDEMNAFVNRDEIYKAHHSSQDHAKPCSAKWFRSGIADVYVKLLTVRCMVTFESRSHVMFNGKWRPAEKGIQMCSPSCNSYFLFTSENEIVVKTTAFPRIRLPIAVKKSFEKPEENAIEKCVLLTSPDRTVVAAMSSRMISPEHNTPLVLCFSEQENIGISLEVHSSGRNIDTFKIVYRKEVGKFNIPYQLDIKSTKFAAKTFDADLFTNRNTNRNRTKRNDK